MSWAAIDGPDGSPDDVHVIPENDLICHIAEDCPCGPLTDPVRREDGSYGWVLVHHSLDGRELIE